MLQLRKLGELAARPAARELTTPVLQSFSCRRTTTNATEHSEDGAPPSLEDSPQIIQETIRVGLLAQQAATALATGRAFAAGRRPDLHSLREEEVEHLAKVKHMVPEYGVRPSLLGPVVGAAFGALGMASAFAPPRLSAAVASGVQDALSDTFNQQLRDMHECGVVKGSEGVRSVVRELRDQERAPEGAPQAPDITSVPKIQELTPVEGVAAICKAATKVLLNAAKRF